jgi:hypothetical protein
MFGLEHVLILSCYSIAKDRLDRMDMLVIGHIVVIEVHAYLSGIGIWS